MPRESATVYVVDDDESIRKARTTAPHMMLNAVSFQGGPRRQSQDRAVAKSSYRDMPNVRMRA